MDSLLLNISLHMIKTNLPFYTRQEISLTDTIKDLEKDKGALTNALDRSKKTQNHLLSQIESLNVNLLDLKSTNMTLNQDLKSALDQKERLLEDHNESQATIKQLEKDKELLETQAATKVEVDPSIISEEVVNLRLRYNELVHELDHIVASRKHTHESHTSLGVSSSRDSVQSGNNQSSTASLDSHDDTSSKKKKKKKSKSGKSKSKNSREKTNSKSSLFDQTDNSYSTHSTKGDPHATSSKDDYSDSDSSEDEVEMPIEAKRKSSSAPAKPKPDDSVALNTIMLIKSRKKDIDHMKGNLQTFGEEDEEEEDNIEGDDGLASNGSANSMGSDDSGLYAKLSQKDEEISKLKITVDNLKKEIVKLSTNTVKARQNSVLLEDKLSKERLKWDTNEADYQKQLLRLQKSLNEVEAEKMTITARTEVSHMDMMTMKEKLNRSLANERKLVRQLKRMEQGGGGPSSGHYEYTGTDTDSVTSMDNSESALTEVLLAKKNSSHNKSKGSSNVRRSRRRSSRASITSSITRTGSDNSSDSDSTNNSNEATPANTPGGSRSSTPRRDRRSHNHPDDKVSTEAAAVPLISSLLTGYVCDKEVQRQSVEKKHDATTTSVIPSLGTSLLSTSSPMTSPSQSPEVVQRKTLMGSMPSVNQDSHKESREGKEGNKRDTERKKGEMAAMISDARYSVYEPIQTNREGASKAPTVTVPGIIRQQATPERTVRRPVVDMATQVEDKSAADTTTQTTPVGDNGEICLTRIFRGLRELTRYTIPATEFNEKDGLYAHACFFPAFVGSDDDRSDVKKSEADISNPVPPSGVPTRASGLKRGTSAPNTSQHSNREKQTVEYFLSSADKSTPNLHHPMVSEQNISEQNVSSALHDVSEKVKTALTFIKHINAMRNRFVAELQAWSSWETGNSRIFLRCLDLVIETLFYLLTRSSDSEENAKNYVANSTELNFQEIKTSLQRAPDGYSQVLLQKLFPSSNSLFPSSNSEVPTNKSVLEDNGSPSERNATSVIVEGERQCQEILKYATLTKQEVHNQLRMLNQVKDGILKAEQSTQLVAGGESIVSIGADSTFQLSGSSVAPSSYQVGYPEDNLDIMNESSVHTLNTSHVLADDKLVSPMGRPITGEPYKSIMGLQRNVATEDSTFIQYIPTNKVLRSVIPSRNGSARGFLARSMAQQYTKADVYKGVTENRLRFEESMQRKKVQQMPSGDRNRGSPPLPGSIRSRIEKVGMDSYLEQLNSSDLAEDEEERVAAQNDDEELRKFIFKQIDNKINASEGGLDANLLRLWNQAADPPADKIESDQKMHDIQVISGEEKNTIEVEEAQSESKEVIAGAHVRTTETNFSENQNDEIQQQAEEEAKRGEVIEQIHVAPPPSSPLDEIESDFASRRHKQKHRQVEFIKQQEKRRIDWIDWKRKMFLDDPFMASPTIDNSFWGKEEVSDQDNKRVARYESGDKIVDQSLETTGRKSPSAKAKVPSSSRSISYMRNKKDPLQQHDVQKLDSAALALIRMQQSFLDVSVTGVQDPNTRANRDEAFLKEALEAARHTQSRGKDPDMAGHIPSNDKDTHSGDQQNLSHQNNTDAGAFAVCASTIINSITQSAERRTLVGKTARKPLVRPTNLVTTTRDSIQEGGSSMIEATGTNFLIDYAPIAPPPNNKEATNSTLQDNVVEMQKKKADKGNKVRGIRGESYFKGLEARPSASLIPNGTTVSPYNKLVEQNQEICLVSRPLSSPKSRPGTSNKPQQHANET